MLRYFLVRHSRETAEDEGLSVSFRQILHSIAELFLYIHEKAFVGKPVVVLLTTGRPMALESVIEDIDALFLAWHPDTEGGHAIADVISGSRSDAFDEQALHILLPVHS